MKKIIKEDIEDFEFNNLATATNISFAKFNVSVESTQTLIRSIH